MSMWLSLAKFSPDFFQVLHSRPALVETIFIEGEAPASMPGFDPALDVFGTRYDDLIGMLTAYVRGVPGPAIIRHDGYETYRTTDPDFEIEDSWVARAAGNGFGERIACELTYGQAFLLTQTEVQAIADGLAAEAWLAELAAYDDDRNIPGLIRFYAAAAREGKAVVGGVN